MSFWSILPFLVDYCAFKPIKAFCCLFFSFLSLQLGFDLDREVYPLVVHAVVDEGDGTGAPCLLPYALPFGGTRPDASSAVSSL